jgi:hypothetical protein
MYVTATRTSGTMDITLQRQRGRLVTHSGRIVKITAPEKRTDQPRVVN